jgi:hypothetical protein
MPEVAALLLLLVVGTVISGAVLWLIIKFVDSGNAFNTLPHTFGVVALLTLVSLIPVLGWLFSIILFVAFLLKVYDLGIGQTFVVLLILFALNYGLRGVLESLANGS